MSNWQFSDQYGNNYPALEDSILSLLVFDTEGGQSPVSGTHFNGNLDLTATGSSMNILASLSGLASLNFTGTVVSNADHSLSVQLQTTDAVNTALKTAFSQLIPILGNEVISSAGISIQVELPPGPPPDDGLTTDSFDFNINIAIGRGSGVLVAQIPMTDGFMILDGRFTNLGIELTDLDFLLPAGQSYSHQFPADQLGPYYNKGGGEGPATALELLGLNFSFYLGSKPHLHFLVNSIRVQIGISNIPLYQKALFLNPLAVWIRVAGLSAVKPVFTWGLIGSIQVYKPAAHNPQGDPDFAFDFEMSIPSPGNPVFGIAGELENKNDLPVSVLLTDMMGEGADLGIASDIIVDSFSFNADADVNEGKVSDFSIEVGLSTPIGAFADFQVESFYVSVDYSS